MKRLFSVRFKRHLIEKCDIKLHSKNMKQCTSIYKAYKASICGLINLKIVVVVNNPFKTKEFEEDEDSLVQYTAHDWILN